MGISTVIAGHAAKLMNPVLLAGLGLLSSALLWLVLAPLVHQKISLATFRRNWKDFLELVLSRGVAGNALIFLGFQLTTAVKAVFLFNLEPAFVAIWSALLLGERISLRQAILILLLLAGGFLLSTGGSIETLTAQTGDLLIVAALVCFSYAYLPAARLLKKTDSISLTASSNCLSGLLLLPLAFLFFGAQPTLTLEQGGWIVAYAITFGVLMLYFYFTALKSTKPWIVSSLLQLAPLPGAALAYLLFGETLTLPQMLGGLVLLATSFEISRERGR